mgnify:CR=1 FL=1
MTHETRTRAKIGVLVPFTNTNLEPDMMLIRAPGTTVHFQRLGGYDVDEIPGSNQMAGLGVSDISHDLRMISGVRPDVVLYGCTSATLTHGPEFDKKLAQDIKAGCGALSFTAAGALVDAIKALSATKVGFSSPYLGEINTQAMDFLSQNRIATVKCADAGRELGNYGQGELTPEEVFDLACQADQPEAQAIVLSCTDMRAVEAVSRIEMALDKPVVTSNQAMMFAVMRALGLPRQSNVPGRLLEVL